MSSPGMIGFDELRRTMQQVSSTYLDIALEAAQDAAAKIIRDAMKSAAPVAVTTESPHPGQLRNSIIIAKRRDNQVRMGYNVQSVKVGPSNKGGFYGYFLSKGWKTAGSKRVARKATKTTHSQSGSATSKKIDPPYPDWADKAAEAVAQQAYDAGAKAFNETLERLIAGAS